MSHERFNDWLSTVLFVVGIVGFGAIGFQALSTGLSIKARLAKTAPLPDDAPRGCDPDCVTRERCATVREDECAAMADAVCERNVGPGATALTYCYATR